MFSISLDKNTVNRLYKDRKIGKYKLVEKFKLNEGTVRITVLDEINDYLYSTDVEILNEGLEYIYTKGDKVELFIRVKPY